MVKVSKSVRKRLDAIVAKRPRTIIQHLLKFGTITTLELTEQYGYEHPPRAIRDVREYGIPLVRFSVKDKAGKTIAAYRFGDLKTWSSLPCKSAGRTLLTKALKKDVNFCLRCFWAHPENYEHVAGKRIRQVSLLFSGDEVEDYCKLIGLAGQDSAQATIKRILHEHLKSVKQK